MTLLCGHYGSGKTNIALNYAKWLRLQDLPVTMADLDIVNPYFRTKDSEEWLNAMGIDLIVSEFANSNLDAPAMPKQIYGLVADYGRYGVLDIGGDDRGALALGRYVEDIKEENNYEMLFVINKSRPLTRTLEDTLEVKWEIENACGLPFTAIVNNTNYALHTTEEDVLASLEYAQKVSEATGLPIKMTCAENKLCKNLAGKVENLFPLTIQELYYMIKAEVQGG